MNEKINKQCQISVRFPGAHVLAKERALSMIMRVAVTSVDISHLAM